MLDGEIYKKALSAGIIIDATIEILSNCNLRCKHCYIENYSRRISLENAKYIIDILFEEGTMNLTFTGGEVFLHPDFMEIFKYAKKKGFIIEIKTNGLLITDDWISLFKEFPPDEINISIYGLSDEEYGEFTGNWVGYSKLINVLDKMKDNDINFNMHVIGNKFNYQNIISGKYQIFFDRYGQELAFDNDLLGGIEGGKEQLKYRLSNKEMIDIEGKSPACIELLQIAYAGIDEDVFECIGGLNKIYIDASENIHTCLYDYNRKFSVIENDWQYIKEELKNRNFEINDKYLKSKCYKCGQQFMCRQCPLKWDRIDDQEERCNLAVCRKKIIESNRLNYDFKNDIYGRQIIKKDYEVYKIDLQFPHFALRERLIDSENDYFSQVAHYKIKYCINGKDVYGNKGKSFYYIPAVDEMTSKILGIPMGHALKLLKWIDDINIACDKINQYFEINHILNINGVAPKVYKKVLVQMTNEASAFVINKLVDYSIGSVLIGLEVEHISLIDYNDTFLFNGQLYSKDTIQTSINEFLTDLGIRGKDLWLGNLANTDDGIKLIDLYEWSKL